MIQKTIEDWIEKNHIPTVNVEGYLMVSKEDLTKLLVKYKTEQLIIDGVVESATPLKECMMGRDAECWHPKCPITMEDAENGKYCTLPLYDYRQ